MTSPDTPIEKPRDSTQSHAPSGGVAIDEVSNRLMVSMWQIGSGSTTVKGDGDESRSVCCVHYNMYRNYCMINGKVLGMPIESKGPKIKPTYIETDLIFLRHRETEGVPEGDRGTAADSSGAVAKPHLPQPGAKPQAPSRKAPTKGALVPVDPR